MTALLSLAHALFFELICGVILPAKKTLGSYTASTVLRDKCK